MEGSEADGGATMSGNRKCSGFLEGAHARFDQGRTQGQGLMKKIKVKGKEGSGQVVKLRPAKPRTSWRAKLPSVGEYGRITRQFILEAVQELKKVTWPERRETLGTTAIVLFLVLVISAFLGLVDLGLSKLVSGFIR